MKNKYFEKVIDLLTKGGVGRVAAYEKFFSEINDQIWIKPLFEKGFFQKPLKVIKNSDGITFPVWVESRYLAKVAPYKGKVASIIMDVVLTWDTDNERVHEDIIDIIMGLPSNKIEPLIEKELEWIEKTPYIYMSLPHKFQELINYLSKEGIDEYALKIAKSLLILLPDPKPINMGDNYFVPTPKTKFDRYLYTEIVRETIPNIYKDKPLITTDFLCGLLNHWIELRRRNGEHYDYSYLWRPQIDKSDERSVYRISDTLVSTIKKISIEYLNDNPKNSNEINDIYEKYSWAIFRRFSMYILQNFPEPLLLNKYLINYDYFIDTTVYNEYGILLKYRYTELKEEEQNKLLEWVDNGPDIDFIKKSHKDRHKKQITDTKLNERIISWKRKKLLPIFNSLNKDLKEKYAYILGDKKEIQDEDIIHFRSSKTWVGPTSPYTVDELKEKSIKDIIQLLKKWKPTEGHMDPSPEGLGRVLKSFITERAQEISKEAHQFIGLEPNYIRGLISGLNDQVKNKEEIHWLPVLKLCDWIMEQRIVIEGREQLSNDWDSYDVNWESTRKNIADLFGNGLSGQGPEIPFKYRERIWNVLSELMNDADPTIKREKESLKERWDPFTDSINCTRGEAMHSIIQYGLWCKRSIEANRKKLFSFDDAIELSEILTLHLDHRHEKSLAVHSVYGHWFPWLLLLDEKWTNNHVTKIFPLEKIKHDYWKAAWQGYINFRSPYNNVLKYLNKSYNYAINESIGYGDKDEEYYPENTHENLVKHILTYYWRGKIKFTPSGLITKLFNIAPQKLRAYAINFAGISLHESPIPIEDKYLNPLIKLWEWRIKEFNNSDNPSEYIDEISNFGAWFGSGMLDTDWSLCQLEFVLEKCKILTNKEWVFKHLTKIVLSNPKRIIKICKSIFSMDLKPWEIHRWEDEIREILEQINNSGSTYDKREALELIDLLCTLGQFQYRDLWASLQN